MKALRDLGAFLSAPSIWIVLAFSALPCEAALEIRHSEAARYASDLTRAYQECEAPNDVSSDGIAACNPPITSACDFLNGTVELTPHAPEARFRLRLNGASCPGAYDALFVLRITEDAAACATGQCTWIDAPFGVEDDGPRVAVDIDIEDLYEAAIGVRPEHVANYEILDVTIRAPDGYVIAAAGVGNHDAKSLKSDVSARYAACTLPDTAPVYGVPACSGPTWGANCDFTAGEVQLSDDGGAAPSVPTVLGEFTGTSGASPLCANGTYEIVSRLRLTGAVCSGNPCTLVDTLATIPVTAVDGVILDGATLAADGLAGPFDSVEVRETFVRNPLAEAAASPAITNAYLIEKPNVTIKFMDTGNPADDRLSLKGKFKSPLIGHPPFDPGIDGATFSVSDQNSPVYAVTIPAGSWEILKPGVSWRYKDDTASLGGVTMGAIKVGAPGKYSKFKLKARDLVLAAADLPTVNLSFSVSSTDVPTSHAVRNANCATKASGRKCKL